jgi:hypothetical protein
VLHSLSPGLILGLLFTLIGAQLTRIVLPGRGAYGWTLLLAAAGVVAGELVAASVHVGGPSLGPLHPIPDAVAIALFEAVGAVLVSPRRGSGRA